VMVLPVSVLTKICMVVVSSYFFVCFFLSSSVAARLRVLDKPSLPSLSSRFGAVSNRY